MTDWIELFAQALPSLDQVSTYLADPSAGGIDLFLGTTRAETSPQGEALLALDYDAYAEMAIKQMTTLATAARNQYPIVKLAILHRTGRVPVAQASVIIGVSTPHRAESFAACKYLIDQLKVDVPIWKKEIWADGAGTWVHKA